MVPDLTTLTEWRRHLHTRPELSGEERETAAFVREKLDALGIPYEAGIGGNGIVATLKRGNSPRSVGLRGDMDALPIAEKDGRAYGSTKPGIMHACGHDGHTVALIGAAAALAANPDWEGTVRFVFQPGEENGTGAKAMIADRLFERFPMDRIFAFHNWPGLEAGTLAVHDGPVMAAGGRWIIALNGLAGHAATPYLTRDPIVAAGHLIVALQTIVSRNVHPFDSVVLSIGSIHGGTVSNQIPGSVTLHGTLRTYNPEVRKTVIATMERITRGIADSFGMTADIDIASTGRAIVNTSREAALATTAGQAAGLTVRSDLYPSGAGDDFSFLMGDKPGAYVWIGNGPAAGDGELHNAGYDFNDSIFPAAIAWMSEVARAALADLS